MAKLAGSKAENHVSALPAKITESAYLDGIIRAVLAHDPVENRPGPDWYTIQEIAAAMQERGSKYVTDTIRKRIYRLVAAEKMEFVIINHNLRYYRLKPSPQDGL